VAHCRRMYVKHFSEIEWESLALILILKVMDRWNVCRSNILLQPEPGEADFNETPQGTIERPLDKVSRNSVDR
jgi:hypothetical protein